MVNILEAFEHKTASPPTHTTNGFADNAEEATGGDVANELEYNDPYCKLSYAQHPEPFVPEIVNIKSEKILSFLL